MTKEHSVKQMAATAKQRFINYELRPESRERSAYENTIARMIKYFQSDATRDELRHNKVKYLNADANGETFDVQSDEAHPNQYTVTAWDNESSPDQPTRSLVVTYDEHDTLQSLQFFGTGDSAPIEATLQPDGKHWATTQITTDSLSKISHAKHDMQARAEEMYGFLRDFYRSYVPVLDGIPDDVQRNLDLITRFKASREVDLPNRLFLGMSRRQFLRDIGLFTAGAIVLASCAPGTFDTPNSPQALAQQHPELQAIIDSGGFDEARYQEILSAEAQGLGPGAKKILYTFLASKAGQDVIAASWQKVATPAFFRDRGILVGQDLKEIFRFKARNGGYLFFDSQSGRYIKMAPEGTIEGNYLRQSANNFKNAWRAAGVPEDVIAKVQIVDGFTYEGKPSVLLSAPDMGQTLETYTKVMYGSYPKYASANISALLERYYVETLIPMNAAGVYQKDPNFKNICLFQEADGSIKLVPIDLAQKPMSFEKGLIFQQQYEELARRAAGYGRNIQMPSYTEFLAAHPDIAQQMSMMAEMGDTVRLHLSIPGESSKVLLVMPERLLGQNAPQGEVMQNIVRSVEQQYGASFRSMPQGSLMPVRIAGEGGETTVMIIKANPVGDSVAAFGGKWGEVLQLGKTGFRVASDFLFILWIAAEVGKYTDPDYSAHLFSDIAFPDSVSWTDNATGTLDAIYGRLMTAKQNLAMKTTSAPMHVSPLAEEMFGVTQQELLGLITGNFMQHGEIIGVLNDMARTAAFPPAPTQVEFESPFPILLDGATLPMSAMFSAFQADNGQQVILFWGQSVKDGQEVTVPITAFQKNNGGSTWDILPIIDKPWTVKFHIYQDEFVLTCKNVNSDGKTFQLQCFKNK